MSDSALADLYQRSCAGPEESDLFLTVEEVCLRDFSFTFSSVADTGVLLRAEAELSLTAALKASDAFNRIRIAVQVELCFVFLSLKTERHMITCEVFATVQSTALLLDLSISSRGNQSRCD